MDQILLDAKKYYKYAKMLLNHLIISENSIVSVANTLELFKTHKNRATNYSKAIGKLKGTDTISLDEAIAKYTFFPGIVAFSRMIENSGFHTDDDRVTVDSISEAMALQEDKEYMVYPDLQVSFTKIWLTSNSELCEKIAEMYDHMFYHAFEIVKTVGGYEKFPKVSVGVIQHSSKIFGSCEMARYVIDDSIDHHDEIEDKVGAKHASKVLLNTLSNDLETAGAKSATDLSMEGLAKNPEIATSVKTFGEKMKEKVESKEIKKSQMVDVYLGISAKCATDPEAMDEKTKIIMNTMAKVCKEKMNSPEIKNNPAAMKVYRDMVKRFYNKDVDTDAELLKKMRSKKSADFMNSL